MFQLLRLVVGIAFFLLPLLVASSRSDSRDDIATLVNCGSICARFDTCMTGIDVATCTRLCRALARSSPDFAGAVATCGSCIADTTCTQATVCWVNCPVVPYAKSE